MSSFILCLDSNCILLILIYTIDIISTFYFVVFIQFFIISIKKWRYNLLKKLYLLDTVALRLFFKLILHKICVAGRTPWYFCIAVDWYNNNVSNLILDDCLKRLIFINKYFPLSYFNFFFLFFLYRLSPNLRIKGKVWCMPHLLNSHTYLFL